MLTPADYAVLAAKEELNILWNTHDNETNTRKKMNMLYDKLEPHAKNGHLGAQLFLAVEHPDLPVDVKKHWLMQLAGNNNPLACLKIAKRHFMGMDGFAQDYSLAAKYLTIALQSQAPKILYEFKEFFKDISTNPKVNSDFKNVAAADAARLQAFSDELAKHHINLDKYLEIEYPFIFDDIKLTEIELIYLSAAENGDLATVKKYLEEGGNPLVKGDSNLTALHKAASAGHLESVKTILEFYKKYDLPVDSIEFERLDTPLTLACCVDHPGIVQVLLEAGANPFMRNSRYNSDAFDRASLLNCNTALDVLNEYTNSARISFSIQAGERKNYISIKTACYGARKENFIGEIAIMSVPFNCSSESDPIFNTLNDYLKAKNINVLVKKYDDRGGITTELSAMQAFHALEYIETMKAKGEIKVNSGKIQDPSAAIESIKKYCQWSHLPPLAVLCVRFMQKSGMISDLSELSKNVVLPSAYSSKYH